MKTIEELLTLVEKDGDTQGMTAAERKFYNEWIADYNANEQDVFQRANAMCNV